MRRIGNRIAMPLFSLLLAASLLFGVTSVMAQAGQQLPCKDDPPTFLGVCVSEADCDRKCLEAGGFDGDCLQNSDGTSCCICAI